MESLLGEMNIKGILFLYERITLILVRIDTTKRVKHKGREIKRKSNQIPRRPLSFYYVCPQRSSVSEVRNET